MLEPQADKPDTLIEHHRRQAALHFEAGDQEAAYWHGRKAQKAVADKMRMARDAELLSGGVFRHE